MPHTTHLYFPYSPQTAQSFRGGLIDFGAAQVRYDTISESSFFSFFSRISSSSWIDSNVFRNRVL